jgi:hypothetical protein
MHRIIQSTIPRAFGAFLSRRIRDDQRIHTHNVHELTFYLRSTWQKGGDKNPSLEHSETLPFVDSIAIPQEKMMQYSADEQIRFTFRSWRGAAVENIFSGTGGGGTTTACLFSNHNDGCGVGRKCTGCDLNGKVRCIKLCCG